MKIENIRLAMLLLNVLLAVSFSGTATAASRPVITSHTPQYSDGALIVTFQWQSENPVLKATLMAGQEQKKASLENDNRRIPQGYHGEAVISTPIQQLPSSETMVYSLQLEDEDRVKSELVQGRLALPRQSMPAGMPVPPPISPPAAWGAGQGQIQAQPAQNQPLQQGQLPPVPRTGVMQQQLLPQEGVVPPPPGMMPPPPGMMPPPPGMMPPPVDPGSTYQVPPPPPPPVM